MVLKLQLTGGLNFKSLNSRLVSIAPSSYL